MGRWWNYWTGKGHVPKNRVESFRCLDSSSCYDGCNHSFNEGAVAYIHGNHLQLFSSHSLAAVHGNGGNWTYKIPVVTTNCNYGGERHWFLCPLPSCKRRSKKLYLCSDGLFLCRKCLKLAYASQNRSRLDRIIDKKWNLIHKLGGDSDSIMYKPKRMHQKTFDKIQEEIWQLNELAEQGIVESFGNPFGLFG